MTLTTKVQRFVASLFTATHLVFDSTEREKTGAFKGWMSVKFLGIPFYINFNFPKFIV
jgi:hypothetical protein